MNKLMGTLCRKKLNLRSCTEQLINCLSQVGITIVIFGNVIVFLMPVINSSVSG